MKKFINKFYVFFLRYTIIIIKINIIIKRRRITKRIKNIYQISENEKKSEELISFFKILAMKLK